MVILFGEGRNEMNYKIQVIIKILSYDLSGGFLSAIALLKLTNEMTTKWEHTWTYKLSMPWNKGQIVCIVSLIKNVLSQTEHMYC